MGGQKKRKGNPGVGVDFKRVKHKVGKKLPKAQNETDVNFKSAVINLPTQTLQQEKEGAAVNFHNLTLKVRSRTVGRHSVDLALGMHGRGHDEGNSAGPACRPTAACTPASISCAHRSC